MTDLDMCDEAGISVLACQAGGICDCFRDRVSEEAADAFRAGERFGLLAARVTIAAEIRDQAERFRLASTKADVSRGYGRGMRDAADIAEGNDA